MVTSILEGNYKEDGLNILEELSCNRAELLQAGVSFDRLTEATDDAAVLLREIKSQIPFYKTVGKLADIGLKRVFTNSGAS